MIQALNLPKKVYFKAGCTPVALRELGEIYHCSRALLVTDPEPVSYTHLTLPTIA